MRRAPIFLVVLFVLLAACEGKEGPGTAPAPEAPAAAPSSGTPEAAAGDAAPELAAQGAESPQLVVVQWIDAVDRGDFQAAAALEAPAIPAEARAAHARTLAEQLAGARRLDDAPFGLSPPEGVPSFASVTLASADGGKQRVRLDLLQQRGAWYVRGFELLGTPPAPDAAEATPPTAAEPTE